MLALQLLQRQIMKHSICLAKRMDKTLNAITSSSSFNFRSKAVSLFRHHFFSFQPRPNSRHLPLSLSNTRSIPFCSLSGNCKVNVLPTGAGEAVREVPQNKFLQVVLVSPQIPGNTGCIARSCAASGVKLHLIEPLGFQVDDTKLKRAGLDYWPYVVVKVHSSWSEFREYYRKQEGEKRLLAFTKRGTNIHSEFSYRKGDWLVFGSETSGLPPEALLDCKSELLGGGTIKIPMIETYVRCLNLSVSVGIAIYEASRQLNYEQFENPSEPCSSDTDTPFLTEDIFA